MIYILEDDNNIRELVTYTLKSVGIDAVGFEKPSDFWRAVEERTPKLIILDIMLPEEDGYRVLRKLRESARCRKTPVIMLTAKSSEYDKVKGLDGGADDYITKPFGMLELVSRVRALLRRTESEPPQEYHIGELDISLQKHRVKVSGDTVPLTLKEFETLCLLAERRGEVITRDELLEKVWGYSFDGGSRTVDVHIRSLRQKLGTAGDMIETVRGIGYKISEETA